VGEHHGHQRGSLGKDRLKTIFHTAAHSVLSSVGLRLMRESSFEALSANAAREFEMLDSLLAALYPYARSYGQLKQDVVALMMSGFKRNGYFVEFGAASGLHLSNTVMLERDFGWTGILSEPARKWHDALSENRSCIIDRRCVWTNSGESIEFNETEMGELSTISRFSDSDLHAERRTGGLTYSVDTVSLDDLLDAHQAPDRIDYLSIDTEGSELDILRAFDLSRRKIGFITCEHNFTPAREEIHDLLVSAGYRRVLTDLSAVDDWYVHSRS
jgi:FkbM family methyltransferase